MYTHTYMSIYIERDIDICIYLFIDIYTHIYILGRQWELALSLAGEMRALLSVFRCWHIHIHMCVYIYIYIYIRAEF